MTREEAIAYAKRVIDLGLNDETQAFCELAIKALEDIPKYKDAYGKGWQEGARASYEHLKMCAEENSGDLISRQVVQTELKNCEVVDIYDENDNFVGYYNADTVDSIVRNLPPVNPQEPKTGHWIVWDTSSYDWTYKCDKCGSIVLKQSNYCPNCGAKMGSEEI